MTDTTAPMEVHKLLTDEQLAEFAHYARLRSIPAHQDSEAMRALLSHIDAQAARIAELGLVETKGDEAMKTPAPMTAERLHEFVVGARGPYTGLVSDLKSTLERIAELEAERDALKADNVELEQLFDLQHKRMVEATALWQEAVGSKNLPDLGSLLTWLMNRSDMIMAERDALRVERDDFEHRAKREWQSAQDLAKSFVAAEARALEAEAALREVAGYDGPGYPSGTCTKIVNDYFDALAQPKVTP